MSLPFLSRTARFLYIFSLRVCMEEGRGMHEEGEQEST